MSNFFSRIFQGRNGLTRFFRLPGYNIELRIIPDAFTREMRAINAAMDARAPREQVVALLDAARKKWGDTDEDIIRADILDSFERGE